MGSLEARLRRLNGKPLARYHHRLSRKRASTDQVYSCHVTCDLEPESRRMAEIHTIELSVRWWSDSQAYAHRTFRLPVDRVAFVLIDCDGIFDPACYDYHTKVSAVTPALHTARRIGMPIIYFHNALEKAARAISTANCTVSAKQRNGLARLGGNPSILAMMIGSHPAIRMRSFKRHIVMAFGIPLPISICARGVSIRC
jgi:hypothetical protein